MQDKWLFFAIHESDDCLLDRDALALDLRRDVVECVGDRFDAPFEDPNPFALELIDHSRHIG